MFLSALKSAAKLVILSKIQPKPCQYVITDIYRMTECNSWCFCLVQFVSFCLPIANKLIEFGETCINSAEKFFCY